MDAMEGFILKWFAVDSICNDLSSIVRMELPLHLSRARVSYSYEDFLLSSPKN